MKASGTNREERTVAESKSGLMDLFTRVTGKMTKQTEEVVLFTPMVMYTTASGKMTKLTDMESTTTLMVQGTRAGGLKISNMERARKFGQIMLATKDNIKTAKSTDMESSFGQMDQPIQEIS